MPPRRRVPVPAGRAALAAWSRGATDPETLATAVRYTVEELGVRAPGRSVEVRVPPYAAVQCIAGPTHRRGTPANVVETDPLTWLALAVGRQSWDEAWRAGRLSVSGTRADLTAFLPVVPDPGGATEEPVGDRPGGRSRAHDVGLRGDVSDPGKEPGHG